jgi:hypothetical protein
MVEVQQNPFRPMQCLAYTLERDWQCACNAVYKIVISSGDCVENSFRFF